QQGGTEYLEHGVSLFSVYRDCLGGFVHHNGEALIAAFTVILALSTIFLWVATRDLVKDARNTAERELRAYIAVGSHGIRPFGGAGYQERSPYWRAQCW